MTTINLMPWREEARGVRQQLFIIASGVVLATTVLIAVLVHLWFASAINHQNHLNQLLKDQIMIYDKQISQIKNLEKIRMGLLSRMAIIQRLQTDRPQIVHLMEEVVTQTPKGIYLVKMTREANQVTLNGFAESNTNISDFMRAIEQSAWLGRANLKQIKQAHKNTQNMNGFTLTMVLNNKPK